MAHETLSEVLDALRHDLGKYLVMPLLMSPRDASQTQLRAALEHALLRTQHGKSGTRGARELYDAARASLVALHVDAVQLTRLDAAVQRALGWEAALADTQRTLLRDVLIEELGAVREVIVVMALEVDDE